MPAEAAAEPAALLHALLSWALVVGVFLGPALLLFLVPKPPWRGQAMLLPPQGPPSLLEVGVIVLVAIGLEGAAAQAFVRAFASEESASARLWWILFAKSTLAPLAVLAAVLLPWFLSRTRPAQLGLTTRDFRRNLVLGYAVWTIVTPIVLGVFWLILQSAGRERHPVETILGDRTDPATWLIVLGSVLVAAPVVEELVHRGVVQAWLSRHPAAADILVAAIFLGVLGHVGEQLWEHGDPGSPWLLVELAVLGPGYVGGIFLSRRRTEANHNFRGIFASSVFFAALHPWPTPIPLFLLGLALGWLRQRTGSLVAPITAHFLFNVVGLLPLMLRQMGAW